jgi:diaminohydroxyphosphoribosylaminopyrimidine deaminase/5-amino-6-(5-phosphoribosylamino)uracil reductase
VVVGCKDPNPLVAGKGIEFLRSKNIRVDTDVLTSASEDQIARFSANVNKIPYITLKWAQSNDLCLSEKGKQTWLSHPYTSFLTHKWRASHDAILIGSQTALIDNPRLDVRNYFGENPVRIIITHNPEGVYDLNIWKDEGETWIITQNEEGLRDKNNKKWIIVPDLHDLNHILTICYKEGLCSILVEGGEKIFRSFIEKGLWHESRVIKTKTAIGAVGIPAPVVQGRLIKKITVMEDEILFIKNKILP